MMCDKESFSAFPNSVVVNLVDGKQQINNNFHKNELILKILFIGDYGVGKTSIIRRYVEGGNNEILGKFSPTYKITIGADFALKSLDWDDDTRINLQLWDIAGHERFGCLTGVYYRYAAAAVIIFDLTRPETFGSVEKWLLDLRRKVQLPCGQAIPIVVLANKGDITIKSVPKEIVSFCNKYNVEAWFITSAKDNVHIDEAMITLINSVLNNKKQLQLPEINPEYLDIIKLGSNEEENLHNQKCCFT